MEKTDGKTFRRRILSLHCVSPVKSYGVFDQIFHNSFSES